MALGRREGMACGLLHVRRPRRGRWHLLLGVLMAAILISRGQRISCRGGHGQQASRRTARAAWLLVEPNIWHTCGRKEGLLEGRVHQRRGGGDVGRPQPQALVVVVGARAAWAAERSRGTFEVHGVGNLRDVVRDMGYDPTRVFKEQAGSCRM